jgi:hypothetical protein
VQRQRGEDLGLPVHAAVLVDRPRRRTGLHRLGLVVQRQAELAVLVAHETDHVGAGRDLGAADLDVDAGVERRPPVAAEAQQLALEAVQHRIVAVLPRGATVGNCHAGDDTIAEHDLRAGGALAFALEDLDVLGGGGEGEAESGGDGREERETHVGWAPEWKMGRVVRPKAEVRPPAARKKSPPGTAGAQAGRKSRLAEWAARRICVRVQH